MRILALLLSMLLLGQSAFAKPDNNDLVIPDLRQLRAMNGISPGPYAEFWEKWPLVTTRYRADNGELRYIYANDIAYQAMKEGKLEFPEGSVFGKVAFVAEEDPQFPNSYEAINFTRLQLMVKDSKRFAATQGWGYWLYVDGAPSDPAEDNANALACHACHTLVKDRDFVFAGPTFLGAKGDWYRRIGQRFEDRFRKREMKDLSEFERKVVGMMPGQSNAVRSLRMRLFSGSLYESIGPLSSFSQSDEPYLLVDPIAKRFLVSRALKPSSGCKKRAVIVMDRQKVKVEDGKRKTTKYISRGIVCDGKNKWVKSWDFPKDL